MLRMDECNKIYKEFHLNGLSKNEIANRFNRSWATVDKIVRLSPEQIATRSNKRNRATKVVTEQVKETVREFFELEIERNIPRKQRYSPAFIFDSLVERQLYCGSFRTLRRFIAEARKNIQKSSPKAFMQLEFKFGHYLQVDHGPTVLILNGHKLAGHLFVASVPGAILRFCQFYPIKSSESWGDFHEKLFTFFGGIFAHIIFDNDSVLKIPKTGELTPFCLELQHHYGFKAIFCNKASGWEKGSVENAVGFCRRRYLPGLQEFTSLEEANIYLREKCHSEIRVGRHYESKKALSELFKELRNELWPLKIERSWCAIKEARVSHQQLIRHKNHRYSVPEKYVGALVQLLATPFEISVAIKNETLAIHERMYIPGRDSIDLDHYLDQLAKKPRAVDFAKVIKQASFDKKLQAIKERLNYKLSAELANRDFINILMLKRESTSQEFEVALELALESGAITYPAIRSILKQLQTDITRSITEIDCDHIKIDHHFNLNKYSELEKRSHYD